MTNLFSRGPSLFFRLLLAMVVSVALIFLDTRLDSFAAVRLVLSSVVAPLQYIANMPKVLMEEVGEQVSTRSQLQKNNDFLHNQNRLLKTDLLLLESLKKENSRLRALLGSNIRQDAKKMVVEIMSVDSDPFSLQVVIDKGLLDGVYEGQPVINELGIVGQVLLVGSTTSRVLLIVDDSHAIPVRASRNDVRAIARGTGELNLLVLDNIPRSTDLRVGDLLVSSGLGQRFPDGYPIARISKFNYEEGKPYAEVEAQPVVELDKIRHLLLLWPTEKSENVSEAYELDKTAEVVNDKH